MRVKCIIIFLASALHALYQKRKESNSNDPEPSDGTLLFDGGKLKQVIKLLNYRKRIVCGCNISYPLLLDFYLIHENILDKSLFADNLFSIAPPAFFCIQYPKNKIETSHLQNLSKTLLLFPAFSCMISARQEIAHRAKNVPPT